MNQPPEKSPLFKQEEAKLAGTYNNLGVQLDGQGKIKEAIAWFKKAISLAPDAGAPYYNMANSLRKLEKLELAAMGYNRALMLDPKHFWARYGLLLCYTPRLYLTQQAILKMREGYSLQLDDLEKSVEILQDNEWAMAAEAVGRFYPYFLAYQGLDDLLLQKRHGLMIHRIMSRCYPEWSKPSIKPSLAKGEKLRVGFVSRFFVDSSVWKIPLAGWIEAIDHDRFETFGYMSKGPVDACTEKAKNWLDHFVMDEFEALAERVKQDNLHALIFTDIGLDTISTKMATLRLASIQCTSLGHPETTGLPTIDYFLSCQEMETTQSSSYFSEKIIPLPHLSIYYTPYRFEPEPFDLSRFGLHADSIKYLCCQTLSKYLPQHDFIFVEIAKKVPKAQFIFIARPAEVSIAFAQRLSQTFHEKGLDANQYVSFMPVISSKQFAYLCASCDVFLDSFEWSGFNTTLEALQRGLPVITLPGLLTRGKHTCAILKRLEMDEMIAKDIDHYLALAVAFGLSQTLRSQASEKIKDRFSRLCKDEKAIRGLEDWLLSLYL